MKCDLEFFESTKGLLGKETAKALLDDLRKRSKAYAKSGLSSAEALDKAASDIAGDYKAEVKQQTYNQYLNILRRKEINEQVFKPEDPQEGLLKYLDKVYLGQVTRNAEFHADMIAEFNKRGVFEHFKNPENEADIYKELYQPGSTQNEKARLVVEATKAFYEKPRKLLNKNGAAIGELPEFIGRQIHDAERLTWTADSWWSHRKLAMNIKKAAASAQEARKAVLNYAFERWKNFIKPRLDHARTFATVDNVDEYLRGVFDDIVFGRFKPVQSGEFKFEGPANRGKKVSQERKLHFKDGQSAYEYNQMYGSGSLPMTITRTLKNMADNLGLMEKMGPNSDMMFEDVAREVDQYVTKNGISKGAFGKVRKARNVYKNINGAIQTRADNLFAKITLGFKAQQTLARLGNIVLNSLPDIALKAHNMRLNGANWIESETRAAFTVPHYLANKAEIDQMNDLVGTMADAKIRHLAYEFGGSLAPSGYMARTIQAYFKMTGSEFWDKMTKGDHVDWLARNLFHQRTKSFNKLDSLLQKSLTEHNIDEALWNAFRKTENIPTLANKKYIIPQAARGFSKETIAEALGKNASELTDREIAEFIDQAEYSLRSYFLSNTHNVNLMPGASEMATINQGETINTPLGMSARLFTQFKGFAFAYGRRILYPLIGPERSLSSMRLLAQLMLSATTWGYISNTVNDLLHGKTPKDPKNFSTFSAALLKGGGLGIYGDFAFGEFNRFGGGFLETLGGPAIGTMNDAARLYTQIREGQKPAYAAYHLALNNLPFINIFYARTALDYLMLYGIQERLSPGSLRRMEINLENQYNQQLILPPARYANTAVADLFSR